MIYYCGGVIDARVPAWLAGHPGALIPTGQRKRQAPANSGLACTALVLVPANLATSGVPYWASLPNVLKVFGSTFPKFHAHPVRSAPNGAGCRLSDQNG